jgi:tubulin--tyrosine ligase-like protein 12
LNEVSVEIQNIEQRKKLHAARALFNKI